MNRNFKERIILMKDFCNYIGIDENIIKEIVEDISEEEIEGLGCDMCIESILQELSNNIEYYFNSGRAEFIDLKQKLLNLKIGERLDLKYINGEYDSFIRISKDIYDIRSNGECITFTDMENCIKFYNGEEIEY